MELEFLVLCLQNFESALASLGFGTTFVAINKQQLLSFPVPLPPLAEQHRIVAKVNELMALCDRLEEAQAEREQRRDGLAAASLRRLRRPVDVGDDDILREHARFHLRYFQRLTTRPEQIVALRHTILSLAVCGRLVSQDPNDESALVQLAASDVVRAATARVDRRADHEGNTLLAAEQKWATPPSWEWRALADLVLFIDYRGRTPKKIKGGVRLITAKNVRKGFVSLSPEEFVSEGEYEAWMTRGIPRDGDVLFTTEAPMGNAAVVHLTERFALAQRVITFHPYGAIHPDFLVLQLLSEPFQVILLKTATGLTAKGIKAAKLKRLPIVVPPLAEQHRVVARVHELMAVCDRLQAQLATAQIESRLLLEAVLHEALLSAA
jgi:type I restriction enzyme S subunit